MEVYFTSPTLGQIAGTVTTLDQKIYRFSGCNVVIKFELARNKDQQWICLNGHRLLDDQIKEIGLQIDKNENQLTAQ